jgi:hypothetical protein
MANDDIFFSWGLAFQIKMSYIVIEEKKNEKNKIFIRKVFI